MEDKKMLAALLAVKECDLRADCLLQCRYAADHGIHIGGAYSAIPILTALYYGGCMRYTPEDPTAGDQDLFILSKGHAVAALAAVYADVGYFSREHLKHTRGEGSLIKGHPGPVIPGVPVSTGPLGQGLAVACGCALQGREEGNRDVYCLAGDGELQEGSCWEAMLFAGSRRLNNLCLLVDKNNGQGDDPAKLLLQMDPLEEKLRAFGFTVYTVDGGSSGQVLEGLKRFGEYPRPLGPTAILCETEKGAGGYAAVTGRHKATIDAAALDGEERLLAAHRERLVQNLARFPLGEIEPQAGRLGYRCETDGTGRLTGLCRRETQVKTRPAEKRDKRLCYDAGSLPELRRDREYASGEIVCRMAEAFARDPRFYTIDADLSNISRLWEGAARTNRTHAINAGIAESTMMCAAEGLALGGGNVWTSTFGPFFNLQAMRRIAISWQERAECIETPGSWLSQGHNLDITFLSTNPDLEAAVNGATHMSNDDAGIFGQIANLKVIDTCCPQQLLAVGRWIAEGNRGLIYLRVMREAVLPLYEADFHFTYGKGYFVRGGRRELCPVIVSSGRGTREALLAAALLEEEGADAAVVDMPSFDGALLAGLVEAGRPILFAEQNNGPLFDQFARFMLLERREIPAGLVGRISALGEDGRPRFIHSGTYEQLLNQLGLTPRAIARSLRALAGI